MSVIRILDRVAVMELGFEFPKNLNDLNHMRSRGIRIHTENRRYTYIRILTANCKMDGNGNGNGNGKK